MNSPSRKAIANSTSGTARSDRRALATRDASPRVDGSGASSSNGSIFTLALLAAALLLLAAPALSQARIVTGGFGQPGTKGGEFQEPRSIAINQTGAGGVTPGTIYVADSQSRIQRFSPNGTFERTWGMNVIGRDERQRITMKNALGGSFTLTFNSETTSPLTLNVQGEGESVFSPQSFNIESALEALPSIGAGNVTVTQGLSTPFTGGPWTVRFKGALGGTNVGQITANPGGLEASDDEEKPLSLTTTTVEDGSGGTAGGYEICTVAAECQDGTSVETTGNGGQIKNANGIAVNQTSGHIYLTEFFGNNRISEFDAAGNFVRTWGKDVIISGKPNDNGTGLEICDTTAGNVPADCKSGDGNGSSAGVVPSFTGAGFPTVDSTGNVWLPDATNHRLTAYTEGGAFLKEVGTGVVNDGAEGTGTLNSSTLVTNLVTTKRYFEAGQKITAPGIPAGTTITEVNEGGGTLTLSQAATESGSKTLVAPEGAGNVPVNEIQTIKFGGTAPSGGAIALEFAGESTGGKGEGLLTGNSNVITGVSSADMSKFKVGQIVNARAFGYLERLPTNTRITAVGANTITLDKVAGGTEFGPIPIFSFDLPYNASANEVETSLNGLGTVGGVGGAVDVTGSPGNWKVEFEGTRFSGADVPKLQVVGREISSLREVFGVPPEVPFTYSEVIPATPNGLEVCTVAADCRAGTVGTAPGQFGDQFLSPDQITFDSSGNLYVLDRSNGRVSKFNAALTSASDFFPSSFSGFSNEAPERQIAVAGGTRLLYSVNNTVSANETQLVEMDLSGNVTDTSLVKGKIPLSQAIGGLAANESTGVQYVTLRSDGPRKILTLGTVAPPDPTKTLNPVTTKTDVNAVFSATVDPTGGLVECAYEYSTNQADWTAVPEPKCSPLDPNGGGQVVSEDLSALEPKVELIPHTHYFVRLAVSRPLIDGSIKYSNVQQFDTDAVPPVVKNLAAVNISDTSARIVVQINPRHSDTSYVVKYGTTVAMSSSTAPIAIGDSPTPQVFAQTIEGLSAGTKYFYEVVATNVPGPAGSGQQTFVTRATPLPPGGGRAYEQVSPVDKSSANVDAVLSGISMMNTIAANGNAISFCTGTSFGDPPAAYALPCAWYRTHRTEAGWQTEAAAPRFCVHNHDESPSGYSAANVLGFDKNLERELFHRPEGGSCSLPPVDPAAPTPNINLYLKDLTDDPFDYDLLTPEPGFTPGYSELHTRVYGGSEDFSHIIYGSTGQQNVDAPAGDFQKLYDYHAGTITLVSRDPAGTPFTTAAEGVIKGHAYNGISSDGNRVLFQTPPIERSYIGSAQTCPSGECHIYMRENNSKTVDVSQSECTSAPCPENKNTASFFQMAIPDTSKVWFTTEQKLTNADSASKGKDLYMYTNGANPATESNNLTLISKDEEPADGTEAGVRAVNGVSDDGNTVFFVASKQLVAGASTKRGYKLYRWQANGGSPTLEYLFTLPLQEKEEALNWSRSGPGPFTTTASGNVPQLRAVSTDGKYLMIQTFSQLVPAADYDTNLDSYRWDPVNGAVCVTCQPAGDPSHGDSGARLTAFGAFEQNNPMAPALANMSADGRKIFFTTKDSLVAGDENGGGENPVQDVYEWNEGTVDLISNGRGSLDSYLLGVSDTADDVFFVTSEKLVGWDIDPNNDIYDARVGGGFPEPGPADPICEGETCRDAGTSPPPAATATTAVFEGPENKRQLAPCGKGFKKAKVKGKLVCKKVKKGKKGKKKRHANNNRRAGR